MDIQFTLYCFIFHHNKITRALSLELPVVLKCSHTLNTTIPGHFVQSRLFPNVTRHLLHVPLPSSWRSAECSLCTTRLRDTYTVQQDEQLVSFNGFHFSLTAITMSFTRLLQAYSAPLLFPSTSTYFPMPSSMTAFRSARKTAFNSTSQIKKHKDNLYAIARSSGWVRVKCYPL